MEGVTVSASMEGQTITTSVFTDEQGRFYFPELPSGRYRIWAQADTYETAHGEIDLTAARHQNFVLQPLKDFERQLTGDQLLASLPVETADDRRLMRVFRNNCTGCHQPNYILQNRFDADGWTAIMNLMERTNTGGAYFGEDAAAEPLIEYHKPELADYLTRLRGPGATAMKFQVRPRPKGDATRVVFTEYAIPLDPVESIEVTYPTNDGSDWSLGTPSSLNGTHGVHDAQADTDGNIWFTYNAGSLDMTIGRVDVLTGEVKKFMVPGPHGMAATSHGIARDQQGNLWFNVNNPGRGGIGGLAKIDPKTEKIDVFSPPKGMTRIGGNTVDVDGKGKVWVTTELGALRFDPELKTFTEFKSPNFLTSDGAGSTYGMAADGQGNGWWAQMPIDIVGHSNVETGKSSEVKLPPVPKEMDLATPAERQMYAMAGSEFHSAVPWAQGPRRLSADKNGNFVWVCDWWGGNLAKIDIDTLKVTIVPLPNPDTQQPYSAAVDNNHNVWTNLMNADEVMKFDPKTSQWTAYPLPTLGAETRHVSLFERDGSLQVILPYWRARKVARMSFRSLEELQALKKQMEQAEEAQGQ
jgi:streptogramin lyase